MGVAAGKMSETPTRRPTLQVPNAPKRPHACVRSGCGGGAHIPPSPIRTPLISAEDEKDFLEKDDNYGEDYSEEYLEPYWGEPPNKRARTKE